MNYRYKSTYKCYIRKNHMVQMKLLYVELNYIQIKTYMIKIFIVLSLTTFQNLEIDAHNTKLLNNLYLL